MTFDEVTVRAALRKSWSIKSARQWTPERPFDGQCNVTAALIQEAYGGEIWKTPWNEQTDHYYNAFAGHRVDLTDDQFDHLIDYRDTLSSRSEAATGFTESEFQSLKSAFLKNIESCGDV